jgi:hypothetical protein
MKTLLPFTATLAVCLAATQTIPDTRAGEAPAAPAQVIQSKRDHGVVSLAPDAALSGDRLIIRVVAYNGDSQPATLSAAAIHITTAAGTPVPVLTLDQLIKEANDAKRTRGAHGSSNAYQPQAITQDTTGAAMRSSSGAVVKGVSAGANTSTGDLATYATPTSTNQDSPRSDAQIQKQIESLKAGILQTLPIAPRSAAGAQIVTDKLTFSANEERTLHVTVDFNGEQYGLIVPVPAGS